MNKAEIKYTEYGSFRYMERLPSTVEVEYPFIALGDLEEFFSRFGVSGNEGSVWQNRLFALQAKYAPKETSFAAVSAVEMNRDLELLVSNETQREDLIVGVAILDRYIQPNGSTRMDRLFRLDISRGVGGSLVPRPGKAESVDCQVEALTQWARDGGFDELLLVDDVLAFGDTSVALIQKLSVELPETRLRMMVGLASSGGGWGGVERVAENTGVEVEALTVVRASEENEWTTGMAVPTSRDFTVFGGKVRVQEDETVGVVPYFLPFSLTVPSFMPVEKRLEASRDFLALSRQMVDWLDSRRGEPIRVGDLKTGIPTSDPKLRVQLIRPDAEMRLAEYLDYCEWVLENYGQLLIGEE